MAIASVQIRCKVCGREFEHRVKKRNRTDAESYKDWALEHIDTCPSCYAAQKRAEELAKAGELLRGVEFPEIRGVSEKQIDYASRLRDAYIGKNAQMLRMAARQKAGVEAIRNDPQKTAEIEAQMRDAGQSTQKGWHDIFTYGGTYATEYMLLTESDAGTIIEKLKYQV